MLLLLPTVGCESLTGTFGGIRPDFQDVPEAALRDAARQVESAVARGDRDPNIRTQEGIVVDTEAIMQAIRTRAARIEQVNRLLDAGYAWERTNGLIAIRTGRDYRQATTSRERDRNASVVYSENQNRWTLYEGVRKASNLRPKALDAVQHVFFEARVANLEPGQMYESADGAPVSAGR
jgi:hypothetical protein